MTKEMKNLSFVDMNDKELVLEEKKSNTKELLDSVNEAIERLSHIQKVLSGKYSQEINRDNKG